MAEDSYYDEYAADFAVAFIESLQHTKGEWYKKPFELIDWQEQIVRDVFGVLKPSGYRQFTTAYVEIPKKMGKSELAAAIALYLTCADGEPIFISKRFHYLYHSLWGFAKAKYTIDTIIVDLCIDLYIDLYIFVADLCIFTFNRHFMRGIMWGFRIDWCIDWCIFVFDLCIYFIPKPVEWDRYPDATITEVFLPASVFSFTYAYRL